MELLEIIGNINDLVWKWVFDFSKPISDNVAVVIIVTSFLVAVLAVTVRRCLLHRSNLFFIPEGIFLLSVSYMVHRLPMIHERLHTALLLQLGYSSSQIFTPMLLNTYPEQLLKIAEILRAISTLVTARSLNMYSPKCFMNIFSGRWTRSGTFCIFGLCMKMIGCPAGSFCAYLSFLLQFMIVNFLKELLCFY